MNWIIVAILAPLMFVIYQILSKLLPRDVSLFLVNAYASLAGAFIMLLIHFIVATNKSIYLTTKTFALTIAIGAFICFGNFFIIKGLSIAPQSSFSAIVYPLLVVYATIAGFLIWHEKINSLQFLGILLSVVGIILVFYSKDSIQIVK